ncbi:unnamed protein product [Coffea canephora]|uniref:Uncharacterized protein n=1 Tax=Coffea canephora TaxID=49390 RepID=A0A068UUB8_COFCA|nr:unnamed protein product [Coffea canephora]
MGKSVFAFLILSGIFMVQSMAARSELKVQELVHLSAKMERSIADPPAVDNGAADHSKEEGGLTEETAAEAPDQVVVRKMSKHHSTDKSVAGGGVIIGGLVAAVFAAVYCYIRVTRKESSSDGEKH